MVSSSKTALLELFSIDIINMRSKRDLCSTRRDHLVTRDRCERTLSNLYRVASAGCDKRIGTFALPW
jgi:hypothetical protein